MNPLLTADSVYKRFGNTVAVNNISFEIYSGEVFGFLGPNGAGKTTTIKMMSGLLKPDSGDIRIDGSDNGRSIGICPQHIVVWENLTTMEQLVFMGKMYNIPLQEANLRAKELMESLGLTSVRNRLAKHLSGGMQRRLNIALALIHSPEIVFLDEPQAGLDPQSRILVRDYIRSIKKKTTIVLTTHDMEEAEKLSDRICIIDRGVVLVSGTADEIKKMNGLEELVEVEIEGDINLEFIPFIDPEIALNMSVSENRASFTTGSPVMVIEYILDIVKKHKLAVKSLRLRKKSLEDVFIQLTGRRIRE